MSEQAPGATVSPAPRCRAAVRAAWQERIARFADSGLSPAQFCSAEGVSLPSFYSWKRRLAAQAAPADEHAPLLLPVRLQPAAPVELLLPGGAVLRITPGCDLAFVRSLLAALGAEPC